MRSLLPSAMREGRLQEERWSGRLRIQTTMSQSWRVGGGGREQTSGALQENVRNFYVIIKTVGEDSPEGGNAKPTPVFYLKNPKDRAAWPDTVHRVKHNEQLSTSRE